MSPADVVSVQVYITDATKFQRMMPSTQVTSRTRGQRGPQS
jgi:hypothetical protein